MINQKAQAEFAVRYYRWATADVHRELSQDLRLLRTVKDPGALADLEYLESLTVDERKAFMLASVKKSNGSCGRCRT